MAWASLPLPGITPAALERLVSDPTLRSAAREVAAEIAAMPRPSEVAAGLVALAR